MLKRILFLILFILALAIPNSSDSYYSICPKQNPAFLHLHSTRVDSLLNSMTLEEKIGQLIMIGSYYADKDQIKECEKAIKKYKPGGLIFFKGNPTQQYELTKQYQQLSATPLFIALDAEWGAAMRLDSIQAFPYQMQLGALQDNQLIYRGGRLIAKELRELGVQINFAPDADINVNPQNPVINHRSFGEDIQNVAEKAYAYMKGLQDEGVIAVAKHFPGHGNTASDSHYQLPLVSDSKETIYSRELVPFQYLINQGVAGVMTAHLSIPAFDSCAFCPSSLSKVLIDTVLKQELGFQGLIFTDALNMGGAKNEDFGSDEIAVRALLAGNDVLLMPVDLKKTIKGIKKAVQNGTIPESLIDEKCRKVLLAKDWAGLFKMDWPKTKPDPVNLNSIEKQKLIEEMIERSISLIHDPKQLIPLQRLDTLSPVCINLNNKGQEFDNILQNYMEMPVITIPETDTPRIEDYTEKLKNANLLIANLTCGSQFAKRDFGVRQELIDFIEKINSSIDVLLVLNGNPYILNRFSNPEQFAAILVSYDQSKLNTQLAAQALFGAREITGRLPVSVKNFNFFSGKMCYGGNRLAFTFPENQGLNSDSLSLIDSIVQDAMNKRAMPGCQILVARNGKVVFEKNYGFNTYQAKTKAKFNQLYDLASLTKVLATLPIVMKLAENKELSLNSTIAENLPDWDTTEIGSAKIIDILGHQAGLPGWIPFYLSTIESDSTRALFYRNKPEEGYTTRVAENLFIMDSYKDSIYDKIAAVELNEDKSYKYSDLGFYLLKKIIELKTGIPIENYCKNLIYEPIGAKRLLFNPLHEFSKDEIVPTEDDQEFRKQLIQGYVHDPGAAMLGGVCGHAGLFGSIMDVAKMMQLYLNGGTYGDFHYLNPETIDYFTSSPFLDNNNRRGIGFDKPEMDYSKPGPCFQGISGTSFGHSGFTGTLVWADPDTGILYVFLSNRVYPDASNSKLISMNVRTKIHEQIYRSLR